jgi:GDP-L-fucose synthase
MKDVLEGWTPPTKLRDGLARTVAWYRANKAQADSKW